MAVVADALQRIDHCAGIDLARSPLHSQPAVGEIEACIDDPRDLLEPVLDLADAAGAANSVDRNVHLRERAVLAHKDRKIGQLRHGHLNEASGGCASGISANRLVKVRSRDPTARPPARSRHERCPASLPATPMPGRSACPWDGTGDRRTCRPCSGLLSRSRATISINVVAPPLADVLTPTCHPRRSCACAAEVSRAKARPA